MINLDLEKEMRRFDLDGAPVTAKELATALETLDQILDKQGDTWATTPELFDDQVIYNVKAHVIEMLQKIEKHWKDRKMVFLYAFSDMMYALSAGILIERLRAGKGKSPHESPSDVLH